MGINFTSITSPQEKVKKASSSKWNKEFTFFGVSFSNRAKEDFYSELSVLLKSGINLKKALDIIGEMQTKEGIKTLVTKISNSIQGGSSFSNALKSQSYFTPYEYQAIHIGEQTGRLAKITAELHRYFASKNELRRQLISSLSYPTIVLVLAVFVILFMLWGVVPLFVGIFKQNRVDLPWLTEKIIALSQLVTENGWLLLGFSLLSIISFTLLRKTRWYYEIIGMIQLKIPVLGNYIKKIYFVQFTQAMALLTNAKIPILQSVKLVRDMIQFHPLEKSLLDIEKSILEGEKLYTSFEEHALFDKKMIALLRVAEETNQTEYIFEKLHDQYNTELQHKGKIITSVLNFVLIFIVGVLVALILIAMYLPMFKLSSVLG